jgi:hypothetical protein
MVMMMIMEMELKKKKRKMKKMELEKMRTLLICLHLGLQNYLSIKISLLICVLMVKKLYSIRNVRWTPMQSVIKLMVLFQELQSMRTTKELSSKKLDVSIRIEETSLF